jgi:threonine dehydratase
VHREPTLADVVAARRVVDRYLVEPSGAAPLAAVRAGKVDPRGRRTVLVVSGGNATAALIARIAAEREAEAIRA